MIQKLINNAKIGKQIWDKEISSEIKGKFRKYFHIRPTSDGFTIVSTHPERAMNGLHSSKLRLKETIIQLANAIKNDRVDWQKTKLKTKKGYFKKTRKSEEEAKLQAWFINQMTEGNQELNKILNVKNLYFIGSEMILHEGRLGHRRKPDVVACDGEGKVLFLELKRSGNKTDNPEIQVEDYVEYYKNNKDYENLILNYPMTKEIKVIKDYVGWVVVGDKNITKIEKVERKERYIKIPE